MGTKFDRDWTVAPGDTLRDWMEENRATVRVTATICGRMPVERLQRILDGKQRVTRKDAAALAYGTGVPASFWLTMERIFRRDLADGKHWTTGAK
jgi:plasmid maintenance system antidote protein VapI